MQNVLATRPGYARLYIPHKENENNTFDGSGGFSKITIHTSSNLL